MKPTTAPAITLAECRLYLERRGVCEAGIEPEACNAPFDCDQRCNLYSQRRLTSDEMAVLRTRDLLEYQDRLKEEIQ